MFTKKLMAAATVAVASLGLAAGSASAAISPASTPVTATSANANFQIFGFINMTCSSGVGFTTPATGNGPVALRGDGAHATPRFNACNIGSVATGSGWRISATATGPTSNTVTITVPGGGAAAGGATITGTICGTITIGAATVTASYTDGASAMTINPSSVPFTSSFCGSGTATFSGTYSVSPSLVIT
jgi:hypothetical protein